MNKQCICPACGAVAEIRRQKNGQQLRYLYCKHGHGGLHTRNRSDEWEKIEREPFGILGEMPPQAKTEDVKTLVTQEQTSTDDWQPDEDTAPETEETPNALSNTAKESEENEPEKSGVGFKIALGVASLFLGGGAFYFAKKRG